MPDPLCRAAIVVGPPKEGIQKKPSVNTPFKKKIYSYQQCSICSAHTWTGMLSTHNIAQKITWYPNLLNTSFATFESAWYRPIHTGIVAKVGKQPKMRSYSGSAPQAIYYTKRPSKLTEPIQVLVKANIFSQQPTFMSELNKIRKNIL